MEIYTYSTSFKVIAGGFRVPVIDPTFIQARDEHAAMFILAAINKIPNMVFRMHDGMGREKIVKILTKVANRNPN